MKKIVVFAVAILVCASMSFLAEGGQIETATIFSVDGKASVIPKGSHLAVEAEEGMQLNEGDWIKTDHGSSVTVAFDEAASNVINVKENTLVILKLDGYFKIQLLSGEIYAFLESVEKDETFRVLMPSVVTESMSSGWGATTDGSYTNVMVFDNEAFICGIKLDGSVDEKKFWIDEGFQRKTIKFQDPGEMKAVPGEVANWFKEQVVAHHLEKSFSRDIKGRSQKPQKQEEKPEAPEIEDRGKEDPEKRKTSNSTSQSSNAARGIFVVDGKEINLVEYLYQERLKQK